MGDLSEAFTLTKAEARAILNFTRPFRKGKSYAVLFQPNVDGRSRVVATDGCSLVVRYGEPVSGKNFAIEALSLTAIQRAIPPGGKGHISVNGEEAQFVAVTPWDFTVLKGTCPISELPPFLDSLESILGPLKKKDRGEDFVGIDPGYLSRLRPISLAIGGQRSEAEYFAGGSTHDPVAFRFRGGTKQEQWRVAIMPVLI